VLVPINFRLVADEVAYIVDHSEADVLILDPELEEPLAGVSCKHRIVLGGPGEEELFRFGAEPREWSPDEAATATINYTSGTTARPKGVQLTHRTLWVNAILMAAHHGVSDRDVYLHTLPMFHANGWGMPYAVTGMGAQHVVLRRVDGAEILRRVERYGVTVMCGAPAVVNMVLEAAGSWDGEVPGRDRVRIIVAGAPPPSRTIERVETELGWEFVQMYGLTETAPLVSVNRRRQEWDSVSPLDRAGKLVRAGAPVLGVSVAADESGEVLVRGNVVLEGYWRQPDETAQALRDGWFHTGDGGLVDDDGYLHILDRKKDVIISGGENVTSIEVEDVLMTHPDVAEVAVIGVPDQRWGETVKALVVRADGSGLTERDLIDYARDRLTHYKCPTSIDFIEALPRTATGKVQKAKLREPFWAGHDRKVN
jgi:acyl-CoA synthetase (AMP-forming)/AMP-acid ligase II